MCKSIMTNIIVTSSFPISCSFQSLQSARSSIGKGQYRHIGVSAKIWYRPIPNKLNGSSNFKYFLGIYVDYFQ